MGGWEAVALAVAGMKASSCQSATWAWGEAVASRREGLKLPRGWGQVA